MTAGRPLTSLCALALVSAAAAPLAGCGTTERVGASRTLTVALTEYRIRPQSVVVSAGSLTVIARNGGLLTHNLVISRDGHVVGTTTPIPPADTATMMVTLTPGTYTMASTIQSDQALGAYGQLKVTS